VEAAKYVETISILKPSEMHIPAARRFTNIGKVRIFCLLQGTGQYNNANYETYTLSLETASSTAPFLAGFPKLKVAVIGGRLNRRHEDDESGIQTYLTEYNSSCSGPNDHEEIFRGLVVSLGGAFKTGLLSQGVTIEGLNPLNWNLVRPCRSRNAHENDPCSWCRNICRQFPLTHVLQEGFLTSIDYWYCLNKKELWAIRVQAGFTPESKAGGRIQSCDELMTSRAHFGPKI
jgi:hypothetical protein